jgi:hypothetical protein
MAYNLRTGLIGSGDIDINVSLSNLTAANITSGVFGVDHIPDMSANKITADTLDAARIPNISANKITADTLDAARIPDISATKITADTLDATRIPNISANKITADTLHVDRIPDLDAAKITSGLIGTHRIPTITNDHIITNTIDSIKIDQASGAFGMGLNPTIPDYKIVVNSIRSSKIKTDSGAFANALIPNISTAKVAPGEALTNNIDATLLESVTVLSKENNQTPATGGDLGCDGDLECEGDATFGSTLTDLCKIKGKLITSGGHHLDAELQLRDHIKAKLAASTMLETYDVSYDEKSGKFTIAAENTSGIYTLHLPAGSAYKLLGFPVNIVQAAYNFTLGKITSVKSVNMMYTDALYLYCDLPTTNINKGTGDHTSFHLSSAFAKIPVNTAPFNNSIYTNINDDYIHQTYQTSSYRQCGPILERVIVKLSR